MAPDRRRHPVLGPSGAIGEPDLAAHRLLAPSKTASMNLMRDRVRAVFVERWISVTQQPAQPLRRERVENHVRPVHDLSNTATKPGMQSRPNSMLTVGGCESARPSTRPGRWNRSAPDSVPEDP
jgi:hypothetical protein